MTQSINEQVRVVAAIKPKAHFLKISLHVLGAELVPATTQAALEEGECGFNSIGVSVATDVFLDSVLDHCVLQSHALYDVPVGCQLVSENDVRILADILAHELFERTACDVFRMEQSQFAIALTDTENGALLGSTSALGESLTASAYIRFIHLNFAVQHGLVARGHCSADSVAEVPCGFVASESKGALNLAGRHALFGFADQQCGDEPFRQRQVRVVEDRARSHGELIIASFAVVERLFGFQFNSGHLAARALDTSWPAQAGEHLAALFVGREHGVYIN